MDSGRGGGPIRFRGDGHNLGRTDRELQTKERNDQTIRGGRFYDIGLKEIKEGTLKEVQRTEKEPKEKGPRKAEQVKEEEILEGLHQETRGFGVHLLMEHAHNIHHNDELLKVLEDINGARDSATIEHACKCLIGYVIWYPKEFLEKIEKIKTDYAERRQVAWFFSKESNTAPFVEICGCRVRVNYEELTEFARDIIAERKE